MKIYICNDNGAEKTWVIKSKDVKSFLKEKDWIDKSEIRAYQINNLHQICIAVSCGAGMYTGEIYQREQDK
jgi:hypothetical protein